MISVETFCRPPVIGQEKMLEQEDSGGGNKPPLPPKPALDSPKERSFQPEGSIDLSPSLSESSTPTYLKWAENMQYLLDDGDGCALFKIYLEQQSLGHLLEFVLAVKGFKVEELDLDLQVRVIKTINKRYVNSLGKNLSSRIECLSAEQRKSLDEKVSKKIGLDKNIFDGIFNSVIEHLESKCYPNFLTSEVYIEHVQSYNNESESSVKYLSSTSSSICGPSNKNQDDSGISGITNATDSIQMSTTSTSCSVSQLLPTVKEDSELNVNLGARPKTTQMSKSMSALKKVESHPNSIASSVSYPYHAHSSTWNPVSRQDSELQSQSSGATEKQVSRKSRNPVQQQKPVKNRENKQCIPRLKIPVEPFSQRATTNPAEFATELIKKLNETLKQESSDNKLKVMLDLNKTKSSTYESYDLESDQSILDEHVDRVFNDERRLNVSSMMDTSRMSNYHHPGYRTMDSARIHGFQGKKIK